LKSLFGKLVITYVALILISFLLITTAMSNSFEEYFMKQKEEALINHGKTIEKEYQRAALTGVIDYDKLDWEIRALGEYLNTRIWLINNRGQIYISSRVEDISMIEMELKYDELKMIFNGEIIMRRGYFKEFFDEQVLTVGYPIKVGDRVVLALFMHASIPEINKTIRDIYRIAFISLVFSTLIALVLIFVVSRKMTKQIKDLNNAVKEIAKGDFDKRINIYSKDEFGELANNVNEMAGELKNLEDMRRTFISNLSHDLRTPLTTINGFINAIIDGTIEKDDVDRYLRIIAEESERLTNLTNNILDLSKMESGQLQLEITDFNIYEVLLNELDKKKKKNIEKKIEVEVNLYKKNYLVKGDVMQIKRVIFNLIDNATKFLNENGKIEIKTYIHENKMYTSIRNTGAA